MKNLIYLNSQNPLIFENQGTINLAKKDGDDMAAELEKINATVVTRSTHIGFDWKKWENYFYTVNPAGIKEYNKKGTPLLIDHRRTIHGVVGIASKITMQNENTLKMDFRLTQAEDFKNIRERISEGLINSVSIGAMPTKIKQIGKKKHGARELTHYVFEEMMLHEVSLVAVPADKKAKIK